MLRLIINIIRAFMYWLRIRRLARDAREIGEAGDIFDPTTYQPEQWRTHARKNTDNRNS